jgi:hypothetical protein
MVMHQGTLYAVDHNEDLLVVKFAEVDSGVSTIRRAIRTRADGAQRGLRSVAGGRNSGSWEWRSVQGRLHDVRRGGDPELSDSSSSTTGRSAVVAAALHVERLRHEI